MTVTEPVADSVRVRERTGAAGAASPGGAAAATGATGAAGAGSGRRRGVVGLYALWAGLALIALAFVDDAARSGEAWAGTAFWAVLLALFAPAAAIVCSPGASARERLRVLVLLGLGLYVAKVLHSPAGFTLHDELVTQRSIADLAASGRLLEPNPVVSAYPLYPGLELVVLALAQVSGLSVFASGLIVVGAMRLVLTCALFTLLRHASGSDRVAGVGALVYAANPSFLFFGAQMAYESFALPLALATLALAAVALQSAPGPRRRGLTALGVLCGAAVVPSHHLTSYALVLMLLLWTYAIAVGRWRGRGLRICPVVTIAATTTAAALAWFAAVGSPTGGYLGPVLGGAVSSAFDVVTGAGDGKAPFQAPGGPANSPLERTLAYASVALLLLLLVVGLWRLRRERPHAALGWVLVALAVLYPATLALRLTEAGAETSGRASEFLFLGLALVTAGVLVAVGAVASALRLARTSRSALVVALLALLFCGGVVIGTAPSARLPGSPLVVSDPRSVEPYGQSAARWAGEHLPARSRVVGDRANALLMAADGGLDPVIGSVAGIHVADLITAPGYGSASRTIVREDAIDVVVADRRLSDDRPGIGYYVDRAEPRAFRYDAPIPLSAVTKLEGTPDLLRVYDNGTVSIYDTAPLRERAPLVTAAASAPAAAREAGGRGVDAARAALGILLVCLLPGLALIGPVVGRRWTLEALALACAASVAVAVLAGLALGAFGIGFGATAWWIALGGVTVVAAVGGLVRRMRGAGADGVADADADTGSATRPARRREAAAVLGVLAALGCAGAAVAIAHASAVDQRRAVPVGELWIGARPGAGAGAFTVGIRNGSRQRATYRLTVSDASHTTSTATVTLAPGAQELRRLVSLTPVGSGRIHVELRGGPPGSGAERHVEL